MSFGLEWPMPFAPKWSMHQMKIRPLRVPDKLDGFAIQVVRRHGRVVLVRKTLPSYPEFVNWEVMIVQVGPPHPHDAQALAEGWEAVERLPGSNSWGVMGWSFTRGEEERMERRWAEACRGWDEHTGEPLPECLPEPDFDLPEPP